MNNNISYFDSLEKKLNVELNIARTARLLGSDPHPYVEIPLAKDLAERVENLIEVQGVANRIRELMKHYTREEAALHIGKDIANGIVGNFKTKKDKADAAIRVSMALLTEGVVAAPIEGIASIDIHKNIDGTEYLRIFYSGPIRSAGGTAQALSVLVGDYVRRILDINKFKPSNELIERYIEEIQLYNIHSSLQYAPSDDEIRLIVTNCPVCIDGDFTEEYEVEGYRNIKELSSNKVRGGMALVIAEGLILKAPKIKKYVTLLNVDGWSFINKLYENKSLKNNNTDTKELLKPKNKYLNDLIAGRPLFSHPSRPGGFRLRYGRSRNTSFASAGLNPSTMVILDGFITNGTQIKVERPGKAAAISSVSSIDGPFVRLKSGDFIQINSYKESLKVKHLIDSIIDIGEILFNYGDFLENNHPLIPSSYCFEWWIQDYNSYFDNNKNILGPIIDNNKYLDLLNISGKKALFYSSKGIPLHPKYTYLWHDITFDQLKQLYNYIYLYGSINYFYELNKQNTIYFDGKIWNNSQCLKLSNKENDFFNIKNILEILLVSHRILNNELYIIEFEPLIVCLGLADIDSTFDNKLIFKNIYSTYSQLKTCNITALNAVNIISKISIKPRALSRIGARMGRPEKSNIRKMSPAAQVLFPIGDFGGNTRNLMNAYNFKLNPNSKKGILKINLGIRECEKCNIKTYKWKCNCGSYTKEKLYCKICNIETDTIYCKKCNRKTTCVKNQTIDFFNILDDAYKNIGIKNSIKTIKGVKDLMNSSHTPEPLEKGILRSLYNVYMFKDGTIRYDMSDLPLTHFKPSEIGISIDQLIKLGYSHDIYHNKLVSEDQIINLFVQDIIVSYDCALYLLNISKYIDELLLRYYHLNKYYNINSIKDLIGILVIGLAPHTSAGILGRIIGFTKCSVCFAHPFFHASKRRNCDGDEDSIMLLLDGFLNFSKEYLPTKRGGKMDAPLVLTTRINPSEIDKEAHNIDVNSIYPIEFYKSSEKMINPSLLDNKMDLISTRLKNNYKLDELMYTHETENIYDGPQYSSYKTLETMEDKILAQLELARKIRAVDVSDVAERVLKSHFLPDIIGNLRAFSKQQTRCVKCSKKFRRPPLIGNCPYCGGNIILTVHEGSVKKYINISKKIAMEYNVSKYIKERIDKINEDIESTFDNNIIKEQLDLSNYI